MGEQGPRMAAIQFEIKSSNPWGAPNFDDKNPCATGRTEVWKNRVGSDAYGEVSGKRFASEVRLGEIKDMPSLLAVRGRRSHCLPLQSR